MGYPQFDLRERRPVEKATAYKNPYLNQYPPKPTRYSKSGVPLVKEKKW